MRITRALLFLCLTFTSSSFAENGHRVTCSNCSIEASTASLTGVIQLPLDTTPQVTFLAPCLGTTAQTLSSGFNYIYATLEGFQSITACPLKASIFNNVPNTLHAANGSLSFTGLALNELTLIADNGNVTAENGGDDLLTIITKNGNSTLNKMGGTIKVENHNGLITLRDVYGYTLEALSDNGSVTAANLTLSSKRTAIITAINGSVSIRHLRARTALGEKNKSVKVLIKAKVVNGSVRDRRSLKERTLTAAERKVAAILRVTAINGDITLR